MPESVLVGNRYDLTAVRGALARITPGAEEGVLDQRKAAVAAVLRDSGRGAEVLLIRRAEHPRDPWSGQMGLPGGRVDASDADPLAAALRETREEIGLDLAGAGTFLGRLSEVRTHLPPGSVPHSVVPFAFSVAGDPALVLNEEVAESVWVPLSFLVDRGNRNRFTWVRKGLPVPMPCYRWEGRVIWGLTLRILDELLDTLHPGRGTASYDE